MKSSDIKSARETRNIPQGEFAKAIGIHPVTFNQKENETGGKTFTPGQQQAARMALMMFDLGKWDEVLDIQIKR